MKKVLILSLMMLLSISMVAAAETQQQLSFVDYLKKIDVGIANTKYNVIRFFSQEINRQELLEENSPLDRDITEHPESRLRISTNAILGSKVSAQYMGYT